MHRARIVSPLLIAAALLACPLAAHSQDEAQRLVNGRDWQRSSPELRRAYLIGFSNAVSVGSRYDTKRGPPGAETFALRVQKGLSGVRMEPALAAVDAWYQAHPSELETPVLSVIWRELAHQPGATQKGGAGS